LVKSAIDLPADAATPVRFTGMWTLTQTRADLLEPDVAEARAELTLRTQAVTAAIMIYRRQLPS